jgi:hypothetical protein
MRYLIKDGRVVEKGSEPVDVDSLEEVMKHAKIVKLGELFKKTIPEEVVYPDKKIVHTPKSVERRVRFVLEG